MAKRITFKDILGLSPRHANFVIEYSKDYAARRAAEASGYEPDHGYKLLQREDIQAALLQATQRRASMSDIDAEWVMWETVDNHLIARQQGNITASNTALGYLMKHKAIDACAASQINLDVSTDREKVERLQRGRERARKATQGETIDHEDDHAETDNLTPSEPPKVSFF